MIVVLCTVLFYVIIAIASWDKMTARTLNTVKCAAVSIISQSRDTLVPQQLSWKVTTRYVLLVFSHVGGRVNLLTGTTRRSNKTRQCVFNNNLLQSNENDSGRVLIVERWFLPTGHYGSAVYATDLCLSVCQSVCCRTDRACFSGIVATLMAM